MNAEEILLAHLTWIDRVVSALARSHGMSLEDAEDFGSWAKLRIIEDDYAILRKFRGESALTTYLTVVISMLFREYRVSRWGRWRPSLAARRLGPLAVRLEQLVYREHHTLLEAGQILRSEDPALPEDRELARLAAQLPPRYFNHPQEAGEPAPNLPDATSSDAASASDDLAVAQAALERALAALDPEDALIMRMMYSEGRTVADVARALRLEQKPLYRRTKQILRNLRQHLEIEGVNRERVAEILSAELDG